MTAAFRVRAGFEKQPGEVLSARGGSLVQGGVSARLLHVHVCSLGDQDPHRLQILAKGDTGVEGLIVHRVAGETMQVGPVSQQQRRSLRATERSRQMQRRPTVGRGFMDQHRLLSQKLFSNNRTVDAQPR